MRIFILVFFLFAAASVSNQVKAQRTFVGVRTGLSVTRLNGLEGNRYSSVSRSYIGANILYRLEQQLTLQSGIEYIQKGYKGTTGKLFNSGNVSYLEQDNARLDYIDIPFLARYQGNRFSVGIGPRYSLLVNINREVQQTFLPNKEQVSFKQNANDNKTYSNSTLGFIIQAAYQLPNGLGADIRFNQDFSPILTKQPFTKIMNIQAGLTYYIKTDNHPLPIKIKSDSLMASQKEYSILDKQNITRVNFQRVGEGSSIRITTYLNSTGVELTDLQLIGSSGNIEQGNIQSGNFTGFRNITFPFKGTITYSINGVPSRLQFTVDAPGDWRLTVGN